MAPCWLCKDTGTQRVVMGPFTDAHYKDVACMCRGKPSPEEALDGLVYRTLNEQQTVDRIANDFKLRGRHVYVDREQVGRYIGRLVEAFGSKLGGLTRAKLTSKVMQKMESCRRRQAKNDGPAYYPGL